MDYSGAKFCDFSFILLVLSCGQTDRRTESQTPLNALLPQLLSSGRSLGWSQNESISSQPSHKSRYVCCWCRSLGHQLTPVPEDSTSADGDRHSNRCQGNGVAIAVNGGDGSGSVARGRSATTPRPPPVVKRSCLRQTTDSRPTVSDLELPRSPRRVDLQRLPGRLRVVGDNTAASAVTDQGSSNNNNSQNGNEDTAGTTTAPANYDHVDTEHLNVDPASFPLGVRLTTVWLSRLRIRV